MRTIAEICWQYAAHGKPRHIHPARICYKSGVVPSVDSKSYP
jgi:hypothetical protein